MIKYKYKGVVLLAESYKGVPDGAKILEGPPREEEAAPDEEVVVIKESDLLEMTKKELMSLATEMGLDVNSKMRKSDIFDMIMENA